LFACPSVRDDVFGLHLCHLALRFGAIEVPEP
jgi:hypothetical protein